MKTTHTSRDISFPPQTSSRSSLSPGQSMMYEGQCRDGVCSFGSALYLWKGYPYSYPYALTPTPTPRQSPQTPRRSTRQGGGSMRRKTTPSPPRQLRFSAEARPSARAHTQLHFARRTVDVESEAEDDALTITAPETRLPPFPSSSSRQERPAQKARGGGVSATTREFWRAAPLADTASTLHHHRHPTATPPHPIGTLTQPYSASHPTLSARTWVREYCWSLRRVALRLSSITFFSPSAFSLAWFCCPPHASPPSLRTL